MAEYLQVATATETRDDAVKLAQSVVAARLAAGAQIVGPVASVFWHQGEFGTGEEWQLLLKTRADRYAALEVHLLEHHPWKNPEVSAVPLAGAVDYLRWIDKSTQPGLD
ncbi:divalent-cation tolerance protein CutA [Streptomyces antioxidans]|uniref:Divalent-cation tolerance protein CutA n=1 Tax=Streptomyces antioxidans TaxID=1507734 RepID=A0A1V4D2A3_9ACTN|nr:divalent-cation tolerance protein CutA [Streptomyces antioxidans]OPF77850.1 divalent-cation tolerance protein CutA [Streptomyces antioxidans]